jgi:hypothetical protein
MAQLYSRTGEGASEECPDGVGAKSGKGDKNDTSTDLEFSEFSIPAGFRREPVVEGVDRKLELV